MKIDNSFKFFLMMFSLFVISFFIGFMIYNYTPKITSDELVSINCDKPFDVVYLKPSEISLASQTANNINGVVVIPELNRVIARTEILNCKGFNYEDYLKIYNGNKIGEFIN